MRRSYIGLDLIRFAAAAMVALYHLVYFWWLPRHATPAEFGAAFRPLAGLVDFGWVGVEVFFVISGFVIAFAAEGKSTRAFAVGRVARLYPGAWLCASITAIVMLAVGRPDGPGWLGSMLLSPVGPWIDGTYWTIGVEIWFYVLVGLTLFFAGSRRIPTLAWMLALGSSAFWTIRLALLAAGVHLDRYLGLWSQVLLLEFGCFFALGIAIWLSTKSGGWNRTRLALVGASLPGCLIELAGHIRSTAQENQVAPGITPLLVWAAAIALMVWLVLGNERLHARFGHHAKTVRTVGLATYPLYLIHSNVGREAMLAIGSPWLAIVLVLPGVCLLAFAVVRAEALIRPAIMRLSPAPQATVPDSLDQAATVRQTA